MLKAIKTVSEPKYQISTPSSAPKSLLSHRNPSTALLQHPKPNIKINYVLFLQSPILATGVAIQTPRQHYTAICDGRDGQSKTFEDGYEITYFCHKNGIVASLLSTQITGNPDECATAYKSYSGCKGSS